MIRSPLANVKPMTATEVYERSRIPRPDIPPNAFVDADGRRQAVPVCHCGLLTRRVNVYRGQLLHTPMYVCRDHGLDWPFLGRFKDGSAAL